MKLTPFSTQFVRMSLLALIVTASGMQSANANILVSLRNQPGGSAPEFILLLGDDGTVLSSSFVDSSYLNGPTGLAYGSDGKLYVSNSTSQEIVRFPGGAPSSGAPELVLNNSSAAITNNPAASLNLPTAIRFDSTGENLYITNSGPYNVSGTLDGTTVTKLNGGVASTLGSDHVGPVQLYLDGYDNVFVSQFGQFAPGVSVRAFEPNGTEIILNPQIDMVGTFGAPGTTGLAGDFSIDTSNANAEAGTLYIASSYGDLVAVYDGSALSFQTSVTAGSFLGPLYTLDSDNLLLGSTLFPYILKYNISGNQVTTFADLSAFGPLAIGDIIFTAAVPEPSAILLVVSAIAGLFVARRRIRR
jgi:hypothetical protein